MFMSQKRVIEYLNYSGIKYQTCEKYLNSIVEKQISKDQCLTILKNYPAIAYGIILDDKEKVKLASMEREMEDWLPSMVPVFTHEQFEKVINVRRTMARHSHFIPWNIFLQKEIFIEGLKSKKEKLENQKDTYARALEDYNLQSKKAEEMDAITNLQDKALKRS